MRSTIAIALLAVVVSGCMWDAHAPTGFQPKGLNDGGTMVGSLSLAGSERAVKVGPDGAVVTLALPPTATWSAGTAINDEGAVAGVVGGAPGAAVWASDGTVTSLPRPAGALVAIATDINATGVVVGFYLTFPNDLHAFVSSPPYASVQELAPPPGFNRAQALAVNRHGQVAGTGGRSDGTTRALRWQLGSPTTVEVLDPEPTTWQTSSAFDINERGVVVGVTGPRVEATELVTWSPGSTTAVPLPSPPGTSGYGGLFLNDHGTVVTSVTLADGTVRPFRLDAGAATWTELAPGASEPIITVTGLNDRGTAVGTAGTATASRAVTFT